MYGGKLQRYEVVELAMHREDFTLTPKTSLHVISLPDTKDILPIVRSE